MFQLDKASLFFEMIGSEHPYLAENIEILHENKITLDESYHEPKYFILNLNNSLRSLIFFIENSIKNSPHWLHSTVKKYKKEHQKEYEILKRLRDVSTHQALIFPKESILTGLYRIKSGQEYIAKIGFGDLQKPGNYSLDLAMKNTEEVFHDLLVFHSIMFMDLEHCALNECLGITRKWFFDIKFTNKGNSYDEIVDVYEMLCQFSMRLLDSVCRAYAKKQGIQFDITFHAPMKEFNCINTLLEIDIYPSLFSDWWETKIPPLNYGVRAKNSAAEVIKAFDEIHYECYKQLCNSQESYKQLLIKYRDLPTTEYFTEENFKEFYSFIYFNHWHFKNSFGGNLLKLPIQPSEIMYTQRLGKIFLDEFKKGKKCTITSTGRDLQKQFDLLCQKI